jgi:hypothetical protein
MIQTMDTLQSGSPPAGFMDSFRKALYGSEPKKLVEIQGGGDVPYNKEVQSYNYALSQLLALLKVAYTTQEAWAQNMGDWKGWMLNLERLTKSLDRTSEVVLATVKGVPASEKAIAAATEKTIDKNRSLTKDNLNLLPVLLRQKSLDALPKQAQAVISQDPTFQQHSGDLVTRKATLDAAKAEVKKQTSLIETSTKDRAKAWDDAFQRFVTSHGVADSKTVDGLRDAVRDEMLK